MVIRSDNTQCLIVKTLGGFSLEYNGKVIKEFSKNKKSQDRMLLQMILVSYKTGISREVIQKEIFADKDLVDVKHTMQSVIYNLKRKLKNAGLPDVNYIEQKKGICRWTGEIPLVLDVEILEDEFDEANAENDVYVKMKHFRKVIDLYKGDFLNGSKGGQWTYRLSVKLNNMFSVAVEAVAEVLRAEKNYIELEKLGRKAMETCPLQNWEELIMEAYVSLHKYEDAFRLYENTVDLYSNAYGTKPSEKIKKYLVQLGEELKHQYTILEDIQSALAEDVTAETGGYMCNYPVFESIYRVTGRLQSKTDCSVYLMLFTIVDGDGYILDEYFIKDELSDALGEIIRQSVRQTDVINKYGKGQYLVLLIDASQEECNAIQRKICSRFERNRKNYRIKCRINNITSENTDM